MGKTAKELNVFIDCKKLQNGLFSFEEISNKGKKSLLMVIVDITERVELIKNIEDKCEKLTNIIEGTNLGTWEWNIQTGEIVVNEQWAKMIGYSLEEILGRVHSYWRSFVHPDENLRSNDILGRYGGEEFIVILNNADEELSKSIIKRILDIIREKTFIFNGNNIKFTFSGGISSCKEIGKEKITIDKLVEIADKRMYKAKNTGRNNIVFKT